MLLPSFNSKVCQFISFAAVLTRAKASHFISFKIALIFFVSSAFLKSNHSNLDLNSAVLFFISSKEKFS